MPGYVDTGLNLVHVDDVAAGHIAAFERGKIGEHYILGGENVRLAQMLCEIAALTGRRPPKIKMPRWLSTRSPPLSRRRPGRLPGALLDARRAAHGQIFDVFLVRKSGT